MKLMVSLFSLSLSLCGRQHDYLTPRAFLIFWKACLWANWCLFDGFYFVAPGTSTTYQSFCPRGWTHRPSTDTFADNEIRSSSSVTLHTLSYQLHDPFPPAMPLKNRQPMSERGKFNASPRDILGRHHPAHACVGSAVAAKRHD
jgi:hypothetical protein